ncbi:Hypothetical protein Minf_2280 [Methylacidiphilum infernorum V4]|uniref:Uncharacterized protein n=1 Tax=Methylacidiphilum infernorum (isolate V4) TaxID=481448 RepID=B3E0A5_METI4|nr:Hypothetical protein Minf_2280 [Methylacidiphilum infernorum V4]
MRREQDGGYIFFSFCLFFFFLFSFGVKWGRLFPGRSRLGPSRIFKPV